MVEPVLLHTTRLHMEEFDIVFRKFLDFLVDKHKINRKQNVFHTQNLPLLFPVISKDWQADITIRINVRVLRYMRRFEVYAWRTRRIIWRKAHHQTVVFVWKWLFLTCREVWAVDTVCWELQINIPKARVIFIRQIKKEKIWRIVLEVFEFLKKKRESDGVMMKK